MNGQEILAPAVALMVWTVIMWFWMYATRIPAMHSSPDIDAPNLVGGVGADLDKVLPKKIQWIAHNYNHLHESPTLFYAVCLTLAILGAGDGTAAMIAWIYVGLRVIHSLIQSLWNRITARFLVYVLSSFALFALIGIAACRIFL